MILEEIEDYFFRDGWFRVNLETFKPLNFGMEDWIKKER